MDPGAREVRMFRKKEVQFIERSNFSAVTSDKSNDPTTNLHYLFSTHINLLYF